MERIDAILRGETDAGGVTTRPHDERPPVAPGGIPIEESQVAAAVMPPAVSTTMLGLMDVMRGNTEVVGGG